MVQLNLNLTKFKWGIYTNNTFYISLMYMYACVRNINDVEVLLQSTHVHTRHVYNNLHKHACMSVIYMPNQVCLCIGMYMNCEPRITV